MAGIGVIGLVCHDRACNAPHLQEVITKHGDVIIGRMGVRSETAERGVICLVVQGDGDAIRSAAVDIAKVEGVTVNHMTLAPE